MDIYAASGVAGLTDQALAIRLSRISLLAARPEPVTALVAGSPRECFPIDKLSDELDHLANFVRQGSQGDLAGVRFAACEGFGELERLLRGNLCRKRRL